MFAILTLLAAGCGGNGCRGGCANKAQRQSFKPARAATIGRRFVLESPLVNGRGHMRVGDSS